MQESLRKEGSTLSSEKILQQKKEIVAEIASKMKEAASFVVVDYQGINVEKVTALREKARELGLDYKIYKNTFLRFAAKECGYDELGDIFVGSSAILFSNDDVVAPAKLIREFATANKMDILNFKGGVVDKKVASVDEITAVSKLASREELLARMVGCFKAPISNLVYALDAIRKEKEQSA